MGPKTNSIHKEMNSGCRAQDQLNTNEPTASYVKAWEINIYVLGDRGNEPGPFVPAASSLTTELPRRLIAKNLFEKQMTEQM